MRDRLGISGAIAAGFLVVGLLLAAGAPLAQVTPATWPTAGSIVSPEVLQDRRVTFRLLAPAATTVQVVGDYASAPDRRNDLVRGPDGVWTLTTAPLAPDYYSYYFLVDGVPLPDPANGEIKPGVRVQQSAFLVPGAAAADLAAAAVPHGEVRTLWYHSAVTGTERRLHIYLPPGYDRSRARYPVSYLFHGGGDDDDAWTTIGRADVILDNMIAHGAAVPMILVMPQLRVSAAASESTRDIDLFRDDLLREVIPLVDRTLRTRRDPRFRAVGGLGIGRPMLPQLIWPMLRSVGEVLFVSGGTSPALFAMLTGIYPGAIDDPRTAARVRFFLSAGTSDASLPDSRYLGDELRRRGYRVSAVQTEGIHGWPSFRRGFIAFARQAFGGPGKLQGKPTARRDTRHRYTGKATRRGEDA